MSYFDDASLVMIPSGYKASKVYSVKPTDGTGDLTFTRSLDTATRVGPDGLIEKVRTNLFLYSEQFNNTAAWQYQGSPIISANASVAPDGTTTADLLYPSVNGSIVAAIQSITSASSVEYTQSVYVKASGKNFVALYTFDGTAGTAMWVNLTTGAITNGVGVNVSNRFATNVGNGWWRIGFTDIGNGTTTYMHVYPTDAASSNSVTASGTNGILLWGAQLETGVTTAYIPTTTAAVSVGPVANVPRLDYLNSSCPRLLLEPQRTNSQTYSEQINNAAWGLSGVTVSANNATSPDGYVNADKVVETATTARHEYYGSSLSFSGNNAVSFYAKYSGRRFFCALGGAGGGGATFDLLNGTVGENTAVSASIQSVGNGWYRCTVVINFTGTNQVYYILRTTASVGIDTYAGDGTSGVLFYGAQTELNASYATSYIPTLGAAVTRGADACSKTGISSLIGQTEGTLFVEMQRLNTGVGSGVVPIQLNDGTNNNRAQIEISSTGAALCIVSSGGSLVANITGPTLTIGQTAKIAISYKVNDFKIFVNGVLAGTDTSGAVPVSMSRVDLASEVGVSYSGFALSQALHFKTALTSTQLAELTA